MNSLEALINLCFDSTNVGCVERPTKKQHKNYTLFKNGKIVEQPICLGRI